MQILFKQISKPLFLVIKNIYLTYSQINLV